ncbi:FAD-linked oxidase C-terminal domain-containing protein [Bacillus tianshenii]|nr:FAD-linked oxidase C-terminal domain-containing protein [Bacillus tianshenii]
MTTYEAIAAVIGEERVTDNETILEQHGKDESGHEGVLPEIVAFVKTKEEVRKILVYANAKGIPVTPFGAGSSLEGHIIPVKRGISLDFSLMNDIIEVYPEDFLVKVQPGVTRKQLNKKLKKYGLFFPVDPGADATLGGMAATNASGTTSVKYGIMRDNVRNLEVVLADGRIIQTGGMARKSSSGLALNGLFVGSEGTLGCFTELTIQVYGIPEYIASARASFEGVEDAINAANSFLSAGIPIARCEFVDAETVRQVNQYNGTSYPEYPMLMLEFHGNEPGVKQDISFMKEIAVEFNCKEIFFETNSKKVAELWEVRHLMSYAYIHSYPKKKFMSTDVCVPLSSLSEAVTYAREALDETGIVGGVFGHVGDGNFHTLMMVDFQNEEEYAKAKAYNQKLVNEALKCGGTCTGEHGVGIGKRQYQQEEHGTAYSVMTELKRMFDPNNILNPGKIYE